ncbi:MAG: hypothetical protein RIR00_1995 [Pseudomonadota bacterium]|jgi:uncharacterized membrane protein (UPF0127 family)
MLPLAASRPGALLRLLLRPLLVLTLVAGLGTSLPLRAEMPRQTLGISFYRIDVEVAANQSDRMQGLMHRQHMPQQQGMLFVFPTAARHCMWMRNTLLPLSVAFLDDNGRILNIEDMAPQTEDSHCASGAARFALEMNKGWFAGKGIKPGTVIEGVLQAPSPR